MSWRVRALRSRTQSRWPFKASAFAAGQGMSTPPKRPPGDLEGVGAWAQGRSGRWVCPPLRLGGKRAAGGDRRLPLIGCGLAAFAWSRAWTSTAAIWSAFSVCGYRSRRTIPEHDLLLGLELFGLGQQRADFRVDVEVLTGCHGHTPMRDHSRAESVPAGSCERARRSTAARIFVQVATVTLLCGVIPASRASGVIARAGTTI